MLDKIRKFGKDVYFPIKDKVKIPYKLMLEKSSFDTLPSKRNQKKQGELLVLLNNEARVNDGSDTTVTEGLSNGLSTQNIPQLTSERGCVKLESDEEWNKFFKLQNNSSTNTTNRKPFSPNKGETQYHGKEIVGKIADQIKSEISKGMKNNVIGSIMIKESKREGDIIYPSVRIVLNDSKEGIDIAKLLSGNICKKYNVKIITFYHPNQEKKRGACCYINDNGQRVYEIINGLYEMNLKWYVDGKECRIKINIDSKCGVRLLEGNGVTEEQLRANKEVKVGKRRDPKSLHEALASQLQQKNSESIKVLQQPSTDVTDVVVPQQQAPAAQAKQVN